MPSIEWVRLIILLASYVTKIHKISLHGSVIIKEGMLPIGQLSKEAAEARKQSFSFIDSKSCAKMFGGSYE